MALTHKELLEKKKAIETAKSELEQLKGQQQVFLKQLKDDYGCKDLKEVKIKINKQKEELAELEQDIKDKTEAFEKKYFTEEGDD